MAVLKLFFVDQSGLELSEIPCFGLLIAGIKGPHYNYPLLSFIIIIIITIFKCCCCCCCLEKQNQTNKKKKTSNWEGSAHLGFHHVGDRGDLRNLRYPRPYPNQTTHPLHQKEAEVDPDPTTAWEWQAKMTGKGDPDLILTCPSPSSLGVGMRLNPERWLSGMKTLAWVTSPTSQKPSLSSVSVDETLLWHQHGLKRLVWAS